MRDIPDDPIIDSLLRTGYPPGYRGYEPEDTDEDEDWEDEEWN